MTQALVLPTSRDIVEPSDSSLGSEVERYLAFKRKRITVSTEKSYAGALKQFLDMYPTARVTDFEPPRGTALIEDFLTERFGHLSARTYNKPLSVLTDFFRWQHARGGIQRDPMLTIERARPRQVHRTTFTDDQRAKILAANPDPHDQISLRLLLDYGLRKGALRAVKFEHFNTDLRRLTIFTKGEKIFTLPLPDLAIWENLELLREPGHHYLLSKQRYRKRAAPRRKQLQRTYDLLAETGENLVVAAEDLHCARELLPLLQTVDLATELLSLVTKAASSRVDRVPDEKIGDHGAHLWWYRCLGRAGIVEEGATSGQRMHKARHTAGQRVLDKTGNLKAAQALLCHATIGTTGDAYTGWETEQLDGTMRTVIPGLEGTR